MKYIYTALISQDAEGVYVARVPDIPGCVTTGSSLSDAIDQITDAAAACLAVAEDEGLDIAPARSQENLPREAGELCALISLDTTACRAAADIKAVRKKENVEI